jgi:Cu(I)/Ag(I) efflux system membrane fusion protein
MTLLEIRSRPLGVALAFVVLAAAGGVAWWATRGAAPAAESGEHAHAAGAPSGAAGAGGPVMLDAAQAARIGVTFAVAAHGPIVQELRSVGQVVFDETRVRTVSLKFDGWVERLHVDFTGREVRAGEPLLVTYAPMLASAEEELLLARQLLRDMRGADTAAQVSAARLLRGARERLTNWGVPPEEIDRLEATGEVRRTLEIRAPHGGTVVEKLVFEGQRVMAGDPLFRIADLGHVWIEGEVFERDLSLIRVGQSVAVELAALPGRPRTGRVVFLQPVVDPVSRTLRVRVELENRDGQLRPGMYATIRVRAVATADVVHVPRSAVLSTGERDLVFVQMADGMLEPREVVGGVVSDDRIEIRSGLAAGEIVVASATFLVDAESNLRTALGAMAGMPDMPGMEMSVPPKSATSPPAVRNH